MTDGSTPTIDLNSDLGEGLGSWEMGDDDALLAVVTSANVACGAHAGDPSIMRRVTARAGEGGVAVGAHVAYRDHVGFGRRFIDMEPHALTDEVVYQVAALDGIARAAGGRVTYVKPHGALYNAIVTHEEQARAVVEAVRAYDDALVLLGLPGSVVLALAEQAGLRTAHEAFADRAYTPEGHLVPRSQPGAVLHDAGEIARRCVAMATGEPITDVNGDRLSVRPHSICVHGDTPGAVVIAREVRGALEGAGVRLAPFAPAG
ncbi:LamB/YcsF family protein [Nocardioides solisilvae]|uniref:LamB/YcsF family protein n=1 Tax=Nocardioides solisilvae TaxID=1542435 RepID=UPI0023B883C3|nr:5-oxoprolinase subunit PxpA [Nocardioides solisilvae]